MDAVPRVAYTYPSIRNLYQLHENECPRLIILDGANIIVSTSLDLISLVRILTAHNFEVVVSLQNKFFVNKVVPFGTSMLKIFYTYGIVADVPKHSLDDLIMLELARVTDGLVLSKDRFSDHQQKQRLAKIVKKNSAQLTYRRLDERLQHKMTIEGHYVATYAFEFPTHSYFYVTPTSPVYDLSKERRVSFTEERKQLIMNLCDKMLLKLREYENNGVDDNDREQQFHKAIIGSIFA